MDIQLEKESRYGNILQTFIKMLMFDVTILDFFHFCISTKTQLAIRPRWVFPGLTGALCKEQSQQICRVEATDLLTN